MDQYSFDFVIIGAGAGGLQLALKMEKDDFFQDKKILILDKDEKASNDRTWCFWESGETLWDQIAFKQWNTGLFIHQKERITFDLAPYRYKMVRSAHFYAYAKAILTRSKNFTWIKEEVKDIRDRVVMTEENEYKAGHIFDSRIPKSYEEKKGQYHTLIQHFKGWFIQTEVPVFDADVFTMMDYRLKWRDSTSFTYVLPLSETEALVEFTLFNDRLLPDNEYDNYIKKYIEDILQIKSYSIKDVEKGLIPMSDYPFHQHHQKHISKIGTAGGWVRPSSGYSFKNADRYSSMMVENIKKGHKPEKGIGISRFRTYDSIFLNVLSKRNDLGEEIFTRLYTKPDIRKVLRFLDEESTLMEDVQVMFSLNRFRFWKAFITPPPR